MRGLPAESRQLPKPHARMHTHGFALWPCAPLEGIKEEAQQRDEAHQPHLLLGVGLAILRAQGANSLVGRSMQHLHSCSAGCAGSRQNGGSRSSRQKRYPRGMAAWPRGKRMQHSSVNAMPRQRHGSDAVRQTPVLARAPPFHNHEVAQRDQHKDASKGDQGQVWVNSMQVRFVYNA